MRIIDRVNFRTKTFLTDVKSFREICYIQDEDIICITEKGKLTTLWFYVTDYSE